MDKKSGEVLYWLSEFISDNGTWYSFCQYADSKGLSPQQIANAINTAAESAGMSCDLTADDCQ